MSTFRRLSRAGGSALSIWELRGSQSQLECVFGQALPTVKNQLRLDCDSFPFDQALLWSRHCPTDAEAAWCIECHLHGGYGVASAFRRWMLQAGWCEEGGENRENQKKNLLWKANSPLAARLAAAHEGGRFVDELQRIEGLSGRLREQAIQAIQAWDGWGRAVEEPPRILLAGSPNAGKSSLFNLWNRAALVTTHPASGTTRDIVCAELLLGNGQEGLCFQLVDSAGLEATTDGLEQEAMRMAVQEIAKAWTVLWVLDAACPPSAEVLGHIHQRAARDLVLLHRIDLGCTWEPSSYGIEADFRGCIQEGEAWIRRLENAVLQALGPPPPPGALVALHNSQRLALRKLQR